MSFKHTAAAIEADGLTHTEKLVLIILAEYADNETGECFPSRDTIARKAMVAPDTVGRLCASLRDKGLISTRPRYRDNGSRTSNSIIVFPPKKVVDDLSFMPTPPTQDRGAPDAGSGTPPTQDRGHNLSDNNLSDEQERDAQARMALRDRLIEAAGEALCDPAKNVNAASPMPLIALLNGTPESPACTVEELIEGVKAAAAYCLGRNGAGSMESWSLAVKKAVEFRNLRLAGVPAAKSKPAGSAPSQNPAAWTEDQWHKAFRVGKAYGWRPEWGPPPGEPGSLVPEKLVAFWKGEVA